MTAEVLRKAASLMRERAEGATTGPWFALDNGVEGAGTVFHDDLVLCYDATHIASWHPAAALAVADLLAAVAEMYDDCDPCEDDPCDYAPCKAQRQAVALAHTYLGETS